MIAYIYFNSTTTARGAITPGFMTPTSGSPNLRANPSILSPGAAPALAIPHSIHVPFGHTREMSGFYVIILAGGAGTRLWPLS